jgi:hypothetical protein
MKRKFHSALRITFIIPDQHIKLKNFIETARWRCSFLGYKFKMRGLLWEDDEIRILLRLANGPSLDFVIKEMVHHEKKI